VGQDTPKISGGSIGKTALANSNKDLVFTVGSGTVTLTGAAAKAISLKDSRGSYTASNTEITLGSDFSGTMDATKYLSSVKTIDGSAAGKAVNITGNGQANVIKAGKGGGTINGGAGNDTLYGGTGDDKLYGGAGDDTLYGGTGNDTINAGTGTNTLYFAKGDGTDIVISGGGSDTLVFSSETNKNNVTASYNGNNLNITYTGGTVILKDYKNGSHSVKYFKVGSTSNWPWTIASILPAPEPEYLKVGGYSIIQGTDAADNLTGTTGKDKLFGGKGNDTLNGGNGDDYLYGGAGDDSITGGAGSDWLFGGSGANKFFFSAGDGEDYINETAMDNTLVFKGLESLEDLSFSAVNRTWDGYYLDEDNERHDYYKYDLKISGYGDSNDSVLITSFFSAQNYDFSNLKLQAGENGETVTLYSMIKNDIETKCPADSSYSSGLKDIQTSYSQVRGLDNDQKYEGLDLTVSGYGHIYTGSGNDKIYLTTEGFELGDSEDSVSNVYSGAGNDLIDMTGLASRDEEKQWVSLDNTEGVNTIRCVVEKEVAGQTKHVLNSPIGIVLDYRIESGFAHSNTRAIEERWGDDKNEMSITAFKRDNDLILANNSLQGIYGGTIIIEDYYKLSEEEQAKISVGFYPTEPDFNDVYEPSVRYSMPVFLTRVLNNENYIPKDMADSNNDDLQSVTSNTPRYKTNWFNLVDKTGDDGAKEINGNVGKANFIVGGANTVTINGGNGHDIIYAGEIEGHDANGDFIGSTKTTGVTINGGGGHDYIIGSAGNDTLNGTKGQNYINGGDGDDTLIGGDLSELDENYGYYKYVNNELIGGKGNDTIWSVTQEKGYQGDTTYFDNYMEGNEGNDTIYANGYRDTVYAGSGDDEIHSWKVSGGSEGMIFGEEGNNRIYLYGDGYQRVEVGDGDNLIDTTKSTGRNGIVTGNGNNTINGGDGEDIITAGFGINTIHAGGGNDTVVVWGDGSVVDSGAGNDTITAYGTTTVNGGSGDDVIYINNGDHGSVSNLTINGNDGNDIYITNAYGQSNYDTIVASSGKDVIKLTAYEGATTQKSGDDLVIIYNHKDANYESSFHTSSLTLKDYYKGEDGFKDFSVQLYSDNYGRNLTDKFSVAEFINYANGGTVFYDTNGTDGDNRIKSANEINGYDGDDFILGIAGDSQIINTGSGNNEVIAQAKQNTITGGDGDDYYNITGGHPADEGVDVSATITDAGGNNTIVIDREYNGPATFKITLEGDGNNTIYGTNALGVYTVSTGNGKQNINVFSVNYNEFSTSITTGSGDDSINIWEGAVNAGAGNDTIAVWGNGGTLSGGAGDDAYISETSAYGNSVGSRIFINDDSGNNNIQLTSKDLTHDEIIFMMNVKRDGTVGNFMFDADNNGTFDTDGNYNACVLGTGDFDNSGSKNAGYIWAAENVVKDSNKGYIRISSIDNMSRIETSDGYYLDTAAINKIKEDVAGWLSEKGFADVQTALSGEDQLTHPNLDTLTGPTYFGGLGWKPKSNLE
jgi:Ca2+-binding RTX toxin-like protein